MQCLAGSKTNSTSNQSRGNVTVFALAVAAVIALMWVAGQSSDQPQVSTAGPVNSSNHSVATLSTQGMEETVVTAPRLQPTELSFEQPQAEVAVSAPTAPKTFWRAAS